MAEQLELKKKKTWSEWSVRVTAPQLIGGVLVIGALSFFAGSHSVQTSLTPVFDARAPQAVDLAPLFKAWELLDAHFAPATTTATTTAEAKLWGAIEGLAQSYGDDYTVFLPPVEKQIFETQVQGDFSGVGMEIGKRGGLLTVIAPIKDTPAYRAGVESGDIIVKINGEQSHDLAVETAVSKIRGPKGSQVTLTLSRASKNNGKEFDITVTRDTIELPTVDFKKRDDGVFVIQVYMFNGQAPRKFGEALYEFEKSKYNKLVIDLRGNPGGYLEAAVDMAGWFIPAGETIVTQDYASESDQVYRSAGVGSLFPGVETVVLLNGGSASASEIFAGALRDHGRASIVGEQSFGKGSVQQVFDVTKDTSLKITIARWLTPKGISISHEGLTPDITVEVPADLEDGADPILDRAVEYLNTGK